MIVHKLDEQKPIPGTKLQWSCRPSFAILSMEPEIRVLAGVHYVLDLQLRHPRLQLFVQRDNLAPVSLAMKEWTYDGPIDYGTDHCCE